MSYVFTKFTDVSKTFDGLYELRTRFEMSGRHGKTYPKITWESLESFEDVDQKVMLEMLLDLFKRLEKNNASQKQCYIRGIVLKLYGPQYLNAFMEPVDLKFLICIWHLAVKQFVFGPFRFESTIPTNTGLIGWTKAFNGPTTNEAAQKAINEGIPYDSLYLTTKALETLLECAKHGGLLEYDPNLECFTEIFVEKQHVMSAIECLDLTIQ